PERDGRKVKTWYMLLHVEELNQEGTGRGRVVRNYTDLEKAQDHQKKLPGLVIYRRTGPGPLQRGDIVNLKPSYSPEVAHRIAELRKGQKPNGPAQATGVEGDVGLNNRQKRRLSHGQ